MAGSGRGVTTSGTARRSWPRPPPETEELLTLWRQQPDRARMERDGTYGVRVGDRWWLWTEHMGAVGNDGDDSAHSGVGEELAALISPGSLMGALRFDPTGRSERVGREVILVDAWQRPSRHPGHDSFVLHELGLGADRSVREGAPFLEIAALELTLDEPLDPALFEFIPPEGEAVRSPLDLHHVKHNVSIAEAQASAPFTVMIPERVPERCTCTITRKAPTRA